MPGSPVEALPGGLLDRLAEAIPAQAIPAQAGPAQADPLVAVVRQCAAGSWAAAGRALEGAVGGPAAAWRRLAWIGAHERLPDGGGRSHTTTGLLGRPPAPDPAAAPDAASQIAGVLLPLLFDARALLMLSGGPLLRPTVDTALAAVAQVQAARPELAAHLDLLAADLLARFGDEAGADDRARTAVDAMTAAGDRLGLAVAAVVAGDRLASPAGPPVHLNCVLRTLGSNPDNALEAEVESREFDGSPGRFAEAGEAYERAAVEYAGAGNAAGLAVVELRRACLRTLEGRPAEGSALADAAHQGLTVAGRVFDAAVAATIRDVAAIADDRFTGIAVPEALIGDCGPGVAYGLGMIFVRMARHWMVAGPAERAEAALRAAMRFWSVLDEPGLRAKTFTDEFQLASAVGDLSAAQVAAMAALDADSEPLPEPADPQDDRRVARAMRAGRIFVWAGNVMDADGMARADRMIRDTVEPLRARLDQLTGMDRFIAEQLLTLAELPSGNVSQVLYRARAAQEKGDDAEADRLFAAARAVVAAAGPEEWDLDESVLLAYTAEFAAASDAFERYAAAALARAAGNRTEVRRRHDEGLAFQLNVGATGRARAHFDALAADADPWWAGLDDPAWRYLHAQGRLAAQEDRLDDAREAFDDALGRVEQLRGDLRRDQFRQGFFASRDVQDLYRDAAGAALRGRAEAIGRGDTAGAADWGAALFGYPNAPAAAPCWT
ncbi:hypothetical protein [Actinoplanes sp. NPDC026619]|uniref:hypothetical protein n=1 Tax=Actinoplanes sp. NPDC026619 TaxID=3155798 RepID=UPI0033C4D5E7